MNTTTSEQTAASMTSRTGDPWPLNTYWPGKDGIFRGIKPGKNRERDRLVFEHTEAFPSAPWQAQMDAAAALEVDGHKDFQLPDNVEGALLYAVAKDEYEPVWHWLRTQDASDPAGAWCQSFCYGDQGNDWKGDGSRARAVRSEPI